MDMDHDEIITYCDIFSCSECPRYCDDCDGEDDYEGDQEQ